MSNQSEQDRPALDELKLVPSGYVHTRMQGLKAQAALWFMRAVEQHNLSNADALELVGAMMETITNNMHRAPSPVARRERMRAMMVGDRLTIRNGEQLVTGIITEIGRAGGVTLEVDGVEPLVARNLIKPRSKLDERLAQLVGRPLADLSDDELDDLVAGIDIKELARMKPDDLEQLVEGVVERLRPELMALRDSGLLSERQVDNVLDTAREGWTPGDLEQAVEQYRDEQQISPTLRTARDAEITRLFEPDDIRLFTTRKDDEQKAGSA